MSDYSLYRFHRHTPRCRFYVETHDPKVLRILLSDPIVSAAAVEGGAGVVASKALKDRAAAKLAAVDVTAPKGTDDGGEDPSETASGMTGATGATGATGGGYGGGGEYDPDGGSDDMEEDEQREVLSFEIDPGQVRHREGVGTCQFNKPGCFLLWKSLCTVNLCRCNGCRWSVIAVLRIMMCRPGAAWQPASSLLPA